MARSGGTPQSQETMKSAPAGELMARARTSTTTGRHAAFSSESKARGGGSAKAAKSARLHAACMASGMLLATSREDMNAANVQAPADNISDDGIPAVPSAQRLALRAMQNHMNWTTRRRGSIAIPGSDGQGNGQASAGSNSSAAPAACVAAMTLMASASPVLIGLRATTCAAARSPSEASGRPRKRGAARERGKKDDADKGK
mmetsp:Transcript_12176/g.37319  ORF Transcript_12176/g.37319 Transcript_12176/m.37319 type:complete len:202 (-) Transcript_12176:1301-1906(-)